MSTYFQNHRYIVAEGWNYGHKAAFFRLDWLNEFLFVMQDLIETIVQLQSQLESQGKRQVDLEDYLDALLMKVMARNPDLLQKNLSMMPASKLTPSIK